MSDVPSRDVHTYDGQWKANVPKYDARVKINVLNRLKEIMISNRLPTIGIDLIIEDINQRGNYENYSDLFADDILVAIIEKLKNLNTEDKTKIVKLVIEQIDDMEKYGRCPSGRVTRLIQIYNAL